MVYFKLKFIDTESVVVWSEILSTDKTSWTPLEKGGAVDGTGKSWDTLKDGLLVVEIYCKGDYKWRSPIVRQQDAELDTEVVKTDTTVTERRDMERKRNDADYTKRATYNMFKEYKWFKVFVEAKQI